MEELRHFELGELRELRGACPPLYRQETLVLGDRWEPGAPFKEGICNSQGKLPQGPSCPIPEWRPRIAGWGGESSEQELLDQDSCPPTPTSFVLSGKPRTSALALAQATACTLQHLCLQNFYRVDSLPHCPPWWCPVTSDSQTS